MQRKNLAPNLVRQRTIIEGTTEKIIMPEDIKSFLLASAKVTDMEVVSGPFAYSAHEMGYGGWIHWKSSGSHFYSYPTATPLFTVDTYTCKPFDLQKLIDFTKDYFNAIEIVGKVVTL